ncbi:MAG TPA: hypothetical protein VF254_07195 [Gammaproteobacteria bacterium]
MTDDIDEFEALRSINAIIERLEDGPRARILTWLAQKYGAEVPRLDDFQNANAAEMTGRTGVAARGNEIPGIARLDADGKLRLTIRDLKAKSTNDAAIRLTHIAIYAYQKLTGEESVSSKSVVVPILKEWRSYTGNTRPALAQHKGILRTGDRLSLDAHSQRDAETYIREALDPSVEGNWRPSSRERRGTKRRKVTSE